MNNPILSICIPTYNRSIYLANCLESLKFQLRENNALNEKIEIVISDNCSTDTTAQVVERYRSDFKNFRYVKNTENVGFDLNVLNVVRNASGKYCWYLGDDDTMINGSLEYVVNKIAGNDYDTVGMEAAPVVKLDDFKNKVEFKDENTEEVKDFNEFYFRGYCQGGFSVLLFDRELWLSLVDERDFLKHWLYYETILKILVATSKKMLYIKQPTILTGQDCRWAENGTELFTFINSNMLLEKMLTFGFNEERVLKNLNENSKRILIIILRAKGHGLKINLYNLRYLYKNLPRAGFGRLFLATLIFFIPNKFIVWLRDFRKSLMNKKQ